MGFTYPNFYFENWNTAANGSGTVVADQSTYAFTSDEDLYAQWVQVSHSVVFFGNLTSTDMTHQTQTGNAPMALTPISQLAFTNPNHQFTGWNTQRDGSGSRYSDQQTYSFVSDLDLYAQWTISIESISFSPNGGVGAVTNLQVAYGGLVTLPLASKFSRPDFKLIGWNTNADGSGTEFAPGATITVSSSQTLYALWTQNRYRVSFQTQASKVHVGTTAILAGNGFRLPSIAKVAVPGFSFVGWYTSASGGAFVGRGGSPFTPTKSATLYAHWSANHLVHLEFSDNGGVGHIPARTVHAGMWVIVPSGAGLHRMGFTFRGWASSPRAPAPTVHIGSRLVVSHTKILYALWRRALPANTPQQLLGSVGVFAPDSSVLTPAMRHAVALIAIGINQHNRTLVLLYGYATAKDSAQGSALLSLQRALAVEKQLSKDLAGLNDVGVTIHAVGEGRLTNSVLTSFRDVEVFAN